MALPYPTVNSIIHLGKVFSCDWNLVRRGHRFKTIPRTISILRLSIFYYSNNLSIHHAFINSSFHLFDILSSIYLSFHHPSFNFSSSSYYYPSCHLFIQYFINLSFFYPFVIRSIHLSISLSIHSLIHPISNFILLSISTISSIYRGVSEKSMLGFLVY